MKLRPYQEAAYQQIQKTVATDRYVLLQSPTGSGKTVLFSTIIQRWMQEFPGMRILILAAQKELIEQAADKLLSVWPEAPIGVVCSGVTKHKNFTAPVVIASRQTLINELKNMAPVHFVIVDEVDQVPPRNVKSQYGKILETLEDKYPDLRVLGVTASPFRLGHGYIYGDRCRPGAKNWFQDLHFQIPIRELQYQDYLVKFRAFEVAKIDLSSVKKTAGDYNLEQLGALMGQDIHISSAVQAYRDYGEARQSTVIFAVTIEHAERLRSAFSAEGYDCGIVHSQMAKDDREETLRAFDTGKLTHVVNVGVLTRGWDCPRADCLVLCRPTESSALHLQIIGRGLRPYPGKRDLLILDLSGNMSTHGVDLDRLRVKIPGAPKEQEEPVSKKCPECNAIMGMREKICPNCGYQASPPTKKTVVGDVIMQEILPMPKETILGDVRIYPEPYVSKKGNAMVRLNISGCRNGYKIPTSVHHYMDIEGQGSAFGQRKAQRLWAVLSGQEPCPETVLEVVERWQEIQIPLSVEIKTDGEFLKVKGW